VADSKKRDVSIHVRLNENCNKKLNEIMVVHGWNTTDAVEYAVIELHRVMVRDGYIPVRYDNDILSDKAVQAAIKVTAAVKRKNLDYYME